MAVVGNIGPINFARLQTNHPYAGDIWNDATLFVNHYVHVPLVFIDGAARLVDTSPGLPALTALVTRYRRGE